MILKIEAKEPLKGHVSVELIGMKRRLEYLKQSNFKLEGEGVESLSNLDSYLQILDLCAKHVKEVRLELEDGTKVENFDSMSDYAECDPIMQEVVKSILQGGKLSPNS